jgi:phage gpG-like protein
MITVFLDNRALLLLDKDLQDLSADLAGANRMRQPLLDSAKEVLGPSINKNFQVGGRPKRWAFVSPVSQYRSSRGMEDSPPLWVTGKMKRAASAMARFKVRNNRMTYGYFPATLWFAGVHDAGAGNIPQRPFALIQANDIDDITRIFMKWYEDRVNAHIRLRYP